jgi:hypothetical protein
MPMAQATGGRWCAGETMPCALANASASASRVRLPCACRAFHAKRCPDWCAHPRMELINMNPSQAHRRPGTRRECSGPGPDPGVLVTAARGSH